MLDAGGELIVKYTAEGDQLIYQATNGYISPEKLSSASFHPSIPEGADVDWTVIKGAYFDDWEPVTVFIQVVNSNGTVDYKTIAYTGAPAYGEFITVQDFGLWGPTWPGAFKLDWKYLDSFETATIAGIEVGMLDAGGELIVKYTAGGDQLIYQATNGYISPEKLSSASFHPSIPEGADLDWTVVKGASFDAWEPVFAFIQVINTNGTFDNEAKAYYEWLGLFNQYRVTAGLDPVIQNSTYSSSIALHTNYMLLNPTQSNLYTEYVGNPGYTDEGKIAAGQSNMIKLIGGTYLTQKLSIDLWMASPSHRYNMLHPDLSQSGFSLQCDSKNCFSGLNILGSLPLSYQVQYKNLIFPADKQQDIPASRYPITWGFYMPWTSATNDNDEVRFVSATIKDHNNNSISYTKVEPYHSDGVWAYVNQVVITPSIDLLPEQTYYVDMTVSYQGQTYSRSWSFTTAP
jgi:hypothetical protein